MEHVVLVNREDEQVGVMEKMEAHQKGLLHRAFSVFIFNDKNEMLLQQRAFEKYHSGGLWTNACCSHPRENESIEAAGKRRLKEELGFTCDVEPVFSFIYKAALDNELTEHELDHVLIGNYNQAPEPNPSEVVNWEYVALDVLEKDLKVNPQNYTVWFRMIYDRVKDRFIRE